MRNYLLYVIGAIVGGISGFVYWKFVGCASGTCKITSSPVNSTIYFAMMGALFFGMFKKEKKYGS
ncbi:MAG: DUF6132 family protein [bacterium]|jgi:hypothetical protein